jgi:hypothetical protein
VEVLKVITMLLRSRVRRAHCAIRETAPLRTYCVELVATSDWSGEAGTHHYPLRPTK